MLPIELNILKKGDGNTTLYKVDNRAAVDISVGQIHWVTTFDISSLSMSFVELYSLFLKKECELNES